MAVTLTSADLEQPTGELSNNFFPAGDLAEMLQGWIDAAKAKVEADSAIVVARHDDAAAAWVYHTAYAYIAKQLAALPSSASEGDGAISVSVAAAQYRYYQELAAAKLAEFNELRAKLSKGRRPAYFGLAKASSKRWYP